MKYEIVRVECDVVFGGTFTDWEDYIYFDDGTILYSQGISASIIELNRTGVFTFEKNYFTYDGYDYKFDDLRSVRYLDDLEIII